MTVLLMDLIFYFQGLKTTLRVMDEESPREENSISNRQLLVKELHIEKIMKRNKVSFLYPRHSKNDERQ